MTRVDDDTLALHLEVALATTAPALLEGLGDPDRRRRHAATGEIARQLAERLHCFDIRDEMIVDRRFDQLSLFPEPSV